MSMLEEANSAGLTRLRCPAVSVYLSRNFDPTPSGSVCTYRTMWGRTFEGILHREKYSSKQGASSVTHLLPLRNSDSRKRMPSLAPAFSFFNLSSPSITTTKKRLPVFTLIRSLVAGNWHCVWLLVQIRLLDKMKDNNDWLSNHVYILF